MRFKVGVVIQEVRMAETVVKAVLIQDGTKTCTIRFLPRHIAVVQRKRDLIAEQFRQVIELYDLSESSAKKSKSDRTRGWQAIAC